MAGHRMVAAVLLVATIAAAGCDGLMGNDRSSRSRDRDAGSGDWTLIAQRSVDFSSDRESIDVGSNQRFHALRVAVKGAPVEVGNMVVSQVRGSAGWTAEDTFAGLPDNMCQAPHWGVVLEGKVRIVTKEAHGAGANGRPGRFPRAARRATRGC